MARGNSLAAQGRTRRACARGLAGWLALWALFIQAFVVQIHVHGLAQWSEPAAADCVAYGAAFDRFDVVRADQEAETLCLVCQAAASGGRAILADASTIVWTIAAPTREPRAVARVIPAAPAHVWRSRAPPISSEHV
jgi:hypothetical protein